jgi:protoporphyrinogen oxidase
MDLGARFPKDKPVVIVGAGPGGLTAAQQLIEHGASVVVFDRDEIVGGIAQTGVYKGFRFDIGGHRFFTKVQVVLDLWRETLGAEFLRRPRLSRIYYNGRFFDYPLKPANALLNLGVLTSVQVLFSYLWIKVFPVRPEVSLEDWVSNRFGRKLFNIFFRTYTEKVWGIPCRTIGAQWAAQRIKGLSLRTAVMNALLGPLAQRRGTIKTLIDEFEYPRLGPGQMWEAFRARIEARGGVVRLRSRVRRLAHRNGQITAVDVDTPQGSVTHPVEHLISTMPIRELVNSLDPPAPAEVVAAADRLKYRDFLTVALIIDEADLFPDNWIYIHDGKVKVGRIQNFKNWSPDMVPDASKTCLGLEYFCNEGDELWTMDDRALVELGRRELAGIGGGGGVAVVVGCVVGIG